MKHKINIALSWENAFKMYFHALSTAKTPKARETILSSIKDEALRLAVHVDSMQK